MIYFIDFKVAVKLVKKWQKAGLTFWESIEKLKEKYGKQEK